MAKKAGKPAPKKKGGRKPLLDPILVAAALAELHGNLAAVAKRYKVTRTSVWEMVEKQPSLRQIVNDAREGMKDNAEGALYRAVLAGEAWAVCFYLKTQAKTRGYVERQEIRDVTDEHVNAAIERELERLAHRREDGISGASQGVPPLVPAPGPTSGSV